MDDQRTERMENLPQLAALPWLLVGLCLLVVGPTAACSGSQQSPAAKLHRSVNTYHQHMRWGRYHEASGYLPIKDRAEFLGRHDELGDDFQIVEYEVKAITVTAEDRAETEVVVQWLREPNMTVNKDKITETWRSFDGAWILVERKVEAKDKRRSRAESKRRAADREVVADDRVGVEH